MRRRTFLSIFILLVQPVCILTSFIPKKLKDLGSLCCSMLGGSSGGRVEGLNENGENELKTSGPLLHFSLFFFLLFFSHPPLPLAFLEQK